MEVKTANRYKSLSLMALASVVRFPNLAMIVMAQYLTAICLAGPKSEWRSFISDPFLFLLSLASVTLAAAGYIINDYYDIKTDSINRPKKVIVGRVIRRRWAIAIHSGLNLLALLMGGLLSFKHFIIFFAVSFWLWLYSNHLKRYAFAGNLSIAALSALSISIVGIYFDRNLWLVNTYALFGFLMALISQVIKDMQNVRGDESFGSRTLPIVWGLRKTKVFIFALSMLFAFLLVLLTLRIGNLRLSMYFILLSPLYLFMLWKLFIADKRQDFRQLSFICKLIIMAGILGMVFV